MITTPQLPQVPPKEFLSKLAKKNCFYDETRGPVKGKISLSLRHGKKSLLLIILWEVLLTEQLMRLFICSVGTWDFDISFEVNWILFEVHSMFSFTEDSRPMKLRSCTS